MIERSTSTQVVTQTTQILIMYCKLYLMSLHSMQVYARTESNQNGSSRTPIMHHAVIPADLCAAPKRQAQNAAERTSSQPPNAMLLFRCPCSTSVPHCVLSLATLPSPGCQSRQKYTKSRSRSTAVPPLRRQVVDGSLLRLSEAV